MLPYVAICCHMLPYVAIGFWGNLFRQSQKWKLQPDTFRALCGFSYLEVVVESPVDFIKLRLTTWPYESGWMIPRPKTQQRAWTRVSTAHSFCWVPAYVEVSIQSWGYHESSSICGIFPSKSTIWLVVGPPLWRIWKSIGMIRNPIYGEIKLMFQTTNQPSSYWAKPTTSSSSCAMLRTGEAPKSPAAQRQEKQQLASPASPPKSFDRSHGWINKKRKNLGTSMNFLVFTRLCAQGWYYELLIVHMTLCSRLVCCSFCLGSFLMPEWFVMPSGFSRKCWGFDTFWVRESQGHWCPTFYSPSTARYARSTYDRWWNWFEHVRFQLGFQPSCEHPKKFCAKGKLKARRGRHERGIDCDGMHCAGSLGGTFLRLKRKDLRKCSPKKRRYDHFVKVLFFFFHYVLSYP